MDIKLSGRGRFSSGECKSIIATGKTTLSGLIKLEELNSHGTLTGESIESTDQLAFKGRAHFSGDLNVKNIYSNGYFSCDKELNATGVVACIGKFKSAKRVNCYDFYLNGKGSVSCGVQAVEINTIGSIESGALITTKGVDIDVYGKVEIESVKGGNVRIKPKRHGLIAFKNITAVVKDFIEGDKVTLERVICPLVTGKEVIIDDLCKIDVVRYSDRVKISEYAKVGKTEKI